MKWRISLGILLASLLIPAYLIGARASSPTNVSVDQALPLTAGELASLLGVQAWTLDVTLPNAAKGYTIQALLLKKGQKKPSVFGIDMFKPEPTGGKQRFIVALVPIGSSLSEAEKVRVIVSAFGCTAAPVIDNPLKNMSIAASAVPEKAADGQYNLIGGFVGTTCTSPMQGYADVIIQLSIQPRN